MGVVIEIDGVRHTLVDDTERGSMCSICSLESICPKVNGEHIAERALCIIFEDFDYHFEIEKRYD